MNVQQRIPDEAVASITRFLKIGLLAGALSLAALAPASAQGGPVSGQRLWDYTGVLMPLANIPPRVPHVWIFPNYTYQYQLPQAIYVPGAVPVARERRAVEPIQVATLTL